MQISSRFTIAVHIFACISIFEKDYKITSGFLSSSIHVNPVIIRNIMLQLKNAGLISVARGTGGISAVKKPDEITFYDVYRAVDLIEDGNLFHFHEHPCPDCPVGRNIHSALDDRLKSVQESMERELQKFTIHDVVREIKERMKDEKCLSGEGETHV